MSVDLSDPHSLITIFVFVTIFLSILIVSLCSYKKNGETMARKTWRAVKRLCCYCSRDACDTMCCCGCSSGASGVGPADAHSHHHHHRSPQQGIVSTVEAAHERSSNSRPHSPRSSSYGGGDVYSEPWCHGELTPAKVVSVIAWRRALVPPDVSSTMSNASSIHDLGAYEHQSSNTSNNNINNNNQRSSSGGGLIGLGAGGGADDPLVNASSSDFLCVQEDGGTLSRGGSTHIGNISPRVSDSRFSPSGDGGGGGSTRRFFSSPSNNNNHNNNNNNRESDTTPTESQPLLGKRK
eukprot:PhM_4_TR7753/c1_g1_i1/m.60911